MPRFAASPAEGGVYVLDTENGEVVFVSHEGHSRVLRAAVTGDAKRTPVFGAHPIDDIVLATFPSPVAWAWQDYLAEVEARQKTRALVDTFTVLLKQWAFATSAAVFASPGLRDADLHRLLERDLQRPLVSSWQRLIEICLPLLERHADASVRGWVDSFARVYAHVQTHCRERITIPRPYLDETGELRSNNGKVGWVEALLALRNEMAHRALASQAIAQEELAAAEPVMRNLLSAAAELTSWQLVEVQADATRGPRARLTAHPWTGRHGRGQPFEVARPRHLPQFTADGGFLGMATREGALIPLPVFYDRDLKGEVPRPAHLLLFDGASSRGIRYVAADGSRRDDQRPLAAWNQLVASISPPPNSITLAALTWESMTRQCSATTAETLAGLEERRIYHPDLEAPRHAIDGALSELLEARRVLVLAGAPGVGKSFGLASIARRRVAAGDAVMLVCASDLEGISPSVQVANALGLPIGTTPEDVVTKLRALDERPRRWLLLVDGLEGASPGAAEWLVAVCQWAEATRASDVLRIVVTLRTSTFDAALHVLARASGDLFVRSPRHDSAEPEPALFVGSFDHQATEDAYERHRKHAIAEGQGAPSTRFADLDAKSSTREILRDPVLMRLLIRAYANRALPQDLQWEEAMSLFVDCTIRDPNQADGGPRWKYLDAFVEWCSRASVEALDRDRIAEHARLGAAVFDTSDQSPYAQLLDLGVLVEDWRDARCVVEVAPNRLFEYLLAARLPCTGTERLLGDIRRLDGLRAAPGAWTLALQRALREGGAPIIVDALDACDQGRWHAARRPLVHALTQVLANLAARDHDELERFLENLVATPSRTDVELLVHAFEAARASGHARAMEPVVRALRAEAAALEDPALQLDVAIRELEVALEGSDGERTGELAAALHGLVDSGADAEQGVRAALAEGRAELAAGRFAEASAHFEQARERAEASGRLGAASDASRWCSTAASNLAKPGRALELAQEALRLAIASGDKAREGAAYHRLASVQHTLEERQSALENYERALVLHRETEHTAHAAASALNLGVLLLDNGETERAQQAIATALAGFEAMGHARGMSVALVNLAQLARLRGDTEEALALAARTHDINASRRSPAEVARDLWLLAELELDRHGLDAAEAYRAALDKVELPDPTRRLVRALHSTALDMRLALLRGADADPYMEGLRASWDAVSACQAHLSPEERPVALLRVLVERGSPAAGADDAFRQLVRGGMLSRWPSATGSDTEATPAVVSSRRGKRRHGG